MVRQVIPALCAVFLSILSWGWTCFAATSEADIDQLIRANAGLSVAEKIDVFSEHFLGEPYIREALGEGEQGKYDRDPLYRFDGFDCTTYVETVVALAHAQDISSFKDILVRIRYKDGAVSFTSRNHFPEVDWVPNNEAAGFIREVTAEVAHDSQWATAQTVINKRGWFEKLPESYINVPGISEDDRVSLWHQLVAEGAKFGKIPASTPYLPLSVIFRNGVPDLDLLARIPSGSVVNVVRPNWQHESDLGTNLNISHQVIVIKKNGRILLRQANSIAKQVTESLLTDELRRYLSSSTIRGIEILEVL
jgi:hypothetical protein